MLSPFARRRTARPSGPTGAVLTGACLDITENTRDALDTTYHEQIADTVLGYTTVALKDYFNHLTANWCKLTTTMRS